MELIDELATVFSHLLIFLYLRDPDGDFNYIPGWLHILLIAGIVGLNLVLVFYDSIGILIKN